MKSEAYKEYENRTCVFCDKRPLSEEEFWPAWVREFYPKIGEDKHFLITYQNQSQDPNHSIFTSREKKINGHSSRKKVKMFCEECNNGWMSGIESEVGPIMKAIFNETIDFLDTKSSRVLAKWAILRAIVADSARPERKGIPPKSIIDFFRRKRACKGWFVWIGKKDHSDMAYYYQDWAGSIPSRNRPFRVDPKTSHPNLMSFTFGLKNMVLYVLYHPDETLQFELMGGLSTKMALLYPIAPFWLRLFTSNNIYWKKLPPLVNADINRLDNNLHINLTSASSQQIPLS